MESFIAKFGQKYGFICSACRPHVRLSFTTFGPNVDLFGEERQTSYSACEEDEVMRRMCVFMCCIYSISSKVWRKKNNNQVQTVLNLEFTVLIERIPPHYEHYYWEQYSWIRME